MAKSLENLRTLDLGKLRPFFPEPPEAARDVAIGLPSDLRLKRRAEKRKHIDALGISNLAESLDTLPDPGESWHIICRGNWAAWQLVPRFIALDPSHRLAYLGIATLGYSRDNIDQLLALIDADTVARCSLLYSAYFRANEKDLTSYASHHLRRRGQQCSAIRTHAKVIAMETGSGQFITVETSANLRSNRNVEQFTITNDRELLDFHRGWLDQLSREDRK